MWTFAELWNAPTPQILNSPTSFLVFLAFLSRMWMTASWVTTRELGGTLCMRVTLAPMVLPSPRVVSPPRKMCLAFRAR